MSDSPPRLEVRGSSKATEYVQALARGLGKFEREERPSLHDRRGRVPVLVQHLDAALYSVSFMPGSRVYGVLSNDQNRFAPPRSLPPILEFRPADAQVREHRIVRYAWSDGAFQLLDSLLQDGHTFGTFEFVELTWQLAQALRFLHGNGVVHGQWNARSVVALPEAGADRLSPHRFELLNTGVVFLSPLAVPEDCLARGYYPPDLFVTRTGVPDLGAMDQTADVYCLAAFLKDLLQRACSTEELPKRAMRLMGELHERAAQNGWRVSAEATRRKELEILDHLYTARARTEYLIQEGLRQRDQRATAETIAGKAEALHRQVAAYVNHLNSRGYEPFDAFAGSGDGILHYTTFTVTLSRERVHGLEDSRLEIRGRDLPQELVRVTLNELSEGIEVAEASPARIVLDLKAGLPGGLYSVSINNRRTNASLEVVTTQWQALAAESVHLPWEGCDPVEIEVRGWQLPRNVSWSLCPIASGTGPTAASEQPIVNVLALGGAGDGGQPGQEIQECPGEDGPKGLERVRLRLPSDMVPGRYQLRVSFLPTRLALQVLPRLPAPVVREGALSESVIRNHRSCRLTLTGQDLHPDMLLDLGEGARFAAIEVRSATEAELSIPAGFPPGDYRLRINRATTDVTLRVEAPQWHDAGVHAVRFRRGQEEPSALELTGNALPPAEVGEPGYCLVDARSRPLPQQAFAAEVATTEADAEAGVERHRLLFRPAARRGRRALHFAGRPTGIEVRVRKPVPRVVQIGGAVVLLAVLATGGLAAVEHLRPEIDVLRTDTVFAVRPGTLGLAGRNIGTIELWPADAVAAGLRAGAEPAASLAAKAVAADAYEVELPEVFPAGRYRLRAIGPLAGSMSRQVLTVRDPELRLQPVLAHRFDDTAFRLLGASGFDVSVFREVRVVPLDGARPARTLAMQGDHFALRAADLDAASVGSYAVQLDSLQLDGLRLDVVGPRLIGGQERPVVPGTGDRIAMSLQIADRGAATWTGLVAAEDGAGKFELAAEPPADGKAGASALTYTATGVPPGRYRIAVGRDADHAEALGPPFAVEPRPRVVAIAPGHLAPDSPERVVIEGINLSALGSLVVRALEGSPDAAKLPPVPIDAALVAPMQDGSLAGAPNGFAQRIEATLKLPSGRFAIAAAGDADGGAAEIVVFDDCQRALASYRRGESGAKDLLAALQAGRPADDVTLAAAGLLFDRGCFAEAAGLYAGRKESQSRFRRSFVAAFVTDQPVEILPAEALADAPGYAAAAQSMKWFLDRGSVAWPEDSLPWEVTFVRAHQEPDPAAARAMLARAEQLRAAAAAPVTAAPFAPFVQLRASLCYREITAGLATDAEAAAVRIRRELIADAAVWSQLAREQQTEALFWSGHAAWFYEGDDRLALEQLVLAAQGRGPAAEWADDYRHALGDKVEAHGGDASWPALFSTVLGAFRQVREKPDYDLLVDPSIRVKARTLDRATVERVRALMVDIERLEATKPLDPFAQCALIYDIRAAQAATWPGEHDQKALLKSRNALETVKIAPGLEPQRHFHLADADLEPLTLAQIVVLPKAELRARIDELEQLSRDTRLSDGLRKRAAELAHRLYLPSVAWTSHQQQQPQRTQ